MVRHNNLTRILLFAVIIIIVTSCQANSETSSATPSKWIQTQDIDSLRPLLFTREDLGWVEGKYSLKTTDLLNRDFVPADDVAAAILELDPSVDGPKGYYRKGNILGVFHTVWEYPDEAKAIRSIEAERDRYSIALGNASEVIARLNKTISGCRQARDPEIGDYFNCKFMGQHGRYLTTVNMTVDEKAITFADWSTLIDAVQNRLIMRVLEDSSSP